MNKSKGRRQASLPMEPLWKLARSMSDRGTNINAGPMSVGFSATVFAEMIGTNPRNVTRWRSNDGFIPWVNADKAACSLGLHPSAVWGDDWWNVKGDFDDFVAEADIDAQADAEADSLIDDHNDASVDEEVEFELVGSFDELAQTI